MPTCWAHFRGVKSGEVVGEGSQALAVHARPQLLEVCLSTLSSSPQRSFLVTQLREG